MKKMLIGTLMSVSLMSTAPAFARQLSLEITNLTNATYFTPLLVAAHPRGVHLFSEGEPASVHLQAMAEGGDIAGLSADVSNASGTVAENPAEGLLAPGASASATLQFNRYYHSRLSVVAMLLPTNDGFVGLDALPIPKRQGTYIYYLKGYDAGTEANDEIITGGGDLGAPGIPADPGGNAGSGGTAMTGPDHNSLVHVHRGVLGDDDPHAGNSDLDRTVHRFQNPVARLTLTIGSGF